MAEIKIRLPDDEKAAIEAAALAVEESVAKWARRALRAAVPKSLRRLGGIREEEPEPPPDTSVRKYVPPEGIIPTAGQVTARPINFTDDGPLRGQEMGPPVTVEEVKANPDLRYAPLPTVTEDCPVCGAKPGEKHRMICPNRREG